MVESGVIERPIADGAAFVSVPAAACAQADEP